MSELRDYFGISPRQRWSSIARQPRFRRLLAPGENPRNLERILKDLYHARDDPQASAMLKKSLTGKARAAAKAVRVKQEADERAAAQDRRESARMARAAAATRRQRLKEQLEQHVDTQQISQQGDVTDNYVWHLDTPLYLFERQGRT